MPVILLVDACEPTCGFWELTISSKGEQSVFLTAEALLSLGLLSYTTQDHLSTGVDILTFYCLLLHSTCPLKMKIFLCLTPQTNINSTISSNLGLLLERNFPVSPWHLLVL